MWPAGALAAGRHTLACVHGPEGMERELNIMVDNGCTVLDVVIEHAVYGQLTGELHLKDRRDGGGVHPPREGRGGGAALRPHGRHPPAHAALPGRGELRAVCGRAAGSGDTAGVSARGG